MRGTKPDAIYVTIYWTSDDLRTSDFDVTLVRRTSDIISLFRSLCINDVICFRCHR